MDDEAELRRLGYAQELLRDMGGFQSFAVSFSVISVLTGAVTLYGYGLNNGGPREVGWGWPLVSVMTLAIAASLGELASAFPTAGALYHWAALLGGPGWGFFTATFNTVGQFAITAGIDYGLAEFVLDLLGFPVDRAHALPVFAAFLLSHAVLNHLGVRVVAVLNALSAWYHLAGVSLIVAGLAWLAPHRPLAFAATAATFTGRPYVWGFAVGLLQAGWTFTGYDASAHVTEETVHPSRNAPWGIFNSVLVSGIAGYALLMAVTLSVQDLAGTAAAANPFRFALEQGLGPMAGRALVWVAVGAMWFCGLASVTSNSRMLFAFARDGGLPRALAKVSERHRTPHWAIWTAAACAFGVAVWADAYSAITALSTVALYASYGLPILLGWRARRAGRWTARGPWQLGRWSGVLNAIALCWIALMMVLLVLPPNAVAGYTFLGLALALVAYWALYLRTRFQGPKVRLI